MKDDPTLFPDEKVRAEAQRRANTRNRPVYLIAKHGEPTVRSDHDPRRLIGFMGEVEILVPGSAMNRPASQGRT